MKLKLASFIFLFCCLFAVRGIAFSDECPEVADQEQSSGGTFAGFGEFDISGEKEGVRYRGQGFTPELPILTAVEFNLKQVGFTDLRVFIDTAEEDSTPEHDINGAIFSFTIPNSELKEGMTKYNFPEDFNVTPGDKYVVYFAPYKNGEYCDDYRDMVWSLGNPYNGGDGVVNVNGRWSVSDWGDIDLQFKTYGRECSGEQGVIYGIVRSFHKGNPPLAGVKVTLTKREDGKWQKYAVEKTIKDGKYRFEELPGGSYRLKFSKPEWISITRRVRLGGGEIRELNIVLDP